MGGNGLPAVSDIECTGRPSPVLQGQWVLLRSVWHMGIKQIAGNAAFWVQEAHGVEMAS